jgi:fucose permease
MAPSAFHGLFDVESAPKITNPEPSYQQSRSKGKTLNDIGVLPPIELDDFNTQKNTGDAIPTSPHVQKAGPHTPKTPYELEMSCPPTPTRDDAVSVTQTWNNPPMNKWRILCCCVIYFANGINDSVVGALIPYMEVYYNNSHSIMSLVFVGNAAGFIAAAFFTTAILGKIGRAKTLVVAQLIIVSAYVILVCSPPYPLVIVS